MSKIPFDPAHPSVDAVRRIVFERLKGDPGWHQLDAGAGGFDPYVEYHGKPHSGVLALHSREVFWQLVNEGILSPGYNSSNLDLPWFRVTEYGRRVLETDPPSPHDPTAYLEFVSRRIESPDATAIAYLAESVGAFRKGSIIASVVMLGVTAERVFDLVCEAMHAALKDTKEQKQLGKLLERMPMKPKLGWVHTKLQTLQPKKLSGFPDQAPMMITVI